MVSRLEQLTYKLNLEMEWHNAYSLGSIYEDRIIMTYQQQNELMRVAKLEASKEAESLMNCNFIVRGYATFHGHLRNEDATVSRLNLLHECMSFLALKAGVKKRNKIGYSFKDELMPYEDVPRPTGHVNVLVSDLGLKNRRGWVITPDQVCKCLQDATATMRGIGNCKWEVFDDSKKKEGVNYHTKSTKHGQSVFNNYPIIHSRALRKHLQLCKKHQIASPVF